VCDPEAFARAVAGAIARDTGNAAYRQRWLELDRTAGAAIGDVLDGVIAPSGPQVARDVARALPGGAELVVASSMPVRDLEWFAGSFGGVTVHANRGVNGIDGTIATATGVAIGTRAPTVVLLGDLAFLHDAGSLLGLAGRGVDLTIVVADNDGGGIFSFLDQRSDSPHDEFERLFGTPHGIDLVELARGYRIDARRVHDAAAVRDALASAIADGNVHVIVVPVLDRDADVAHHRDLWAAAAAATAIAPTTGRVSGG
jgi:2-succinyl-5-enolpyruvyl-6-hydroxy-3-cyclohexene-1-carboxylate synthase